MSVPISQMWTVAKYVVTQKLKGRKRYPLVLMLEPLYRCNLACAGCGKIQHPKEVLKQHLSVEACLHAANECGAPIVSIPGGEPLLHPEIDQIAAGLVAQKRYVYLCTNAIKLEESLPKFKPSKYLSFSVHLDGPKEVHDAAVCREGIYEKAVSAIRAAKQAGFRVTTNTTVFEGTPVAELRKLFDTLADLKVEGMMVSPGYAYPKAPDQEHFLERNRTHKLFAELLKDAPRRWKFNQTPLFLDYLQGNVPQKNTPLGKQPALDCTPWGSPTYSLFGWQKPCYLLDNEGYCDTFAELMETDFHDYGHASGNPACANCLVHCGFEPSAVDATFGSMTGMLRSARIFMFGLPKGKGLQLPSDVRIDRPHTPVAGSFVSVDDVGKRTAVKN